MPDVLPAEGFLDVVDGRGDAGAGIDLGEPEVGAEVREDAPGPDAFAE